MTKTITRAKLRAKIERGDDLGLLETLSARRFAHGRQAASGTGSQLA